MPCVPVGTLTSVPRRRTVPFGSVSRRSVPSDSPVDECIFTSADASAIATSPLALSYVWLWQAAATTRMATTDELLRIADSGTDEGQNGSFQASVRSRAPSGGDDG